MKYFLFINFLSFLYCYSISGTVQDLKNGEPIGYSNIIIEENGVGTASDNNGYYRTYTNSVFINSKVLVPFYRTEYDTIYS